MSNMDKKMSTNEQPIINLNDLAEAIASYLQPPAPSVPLEKQLWGSQECASYLKKSVSRFMQHIAPHPAFPKAIRLPTGEKGQSQPLWKAIEIIEYAFKHQEKR